MVENRNQSALLVAFHFPPLQGSSGMQRTLGFARHLPKSGWTPLVLTPGVGAYPHTDQRQNGLIPDNLHVQRSFCLDSARHLALFGRYPDSFAIPDRWISWIPGAVLSGLRMIRRHRPRVIWSTYPIATTHIVGHTLARLSGLPWVVDFRDPMVEQNPRTGAMAPPDPRIRKARLSIERRCVEHASALVFCTAQARDICLGRYPELNANRCHVITNGYEEHIFQLAEKQPQRNTISVPDDTHQITLLHSGTIYPTPDRDPRPFFDAVATLKASGTITPETLQIKLRATGHDEVMSAALRKRGVGDIVTLHPSLPYIDALAEILSADGLLLFQGYTSNPAIPAKLYEYLRAQRPLLAMLAPEGSTAELLQSLNTGQQAPIEDAGTITGVLQTFIDNVRSGNAISASQKDIEQFSRKALSSQLASLFDALSSRSA